MTDFLFNRLEELADTLDDPEREKMFKYLEHIKKEIEDIPYD